ncbi:DUF4339 domain-containing protein [Rubritalea spongiae]|uniref:DUF4339 domain-containing protein n=1 Tax=Rubritalea spongiae TaxID=430797 RepID=A0ABW5E4G3_9BACT
MQIYPWYYTHTGKRHGPVSNDQIRKLIIERKIQPDTCLLWQEGMHSWIPIKDIDEFQASLDLIQRMDQKQHVSSSKDGQILTRALETRRSQHKTSLFSKHAHFWLTFRILTAAILLAYTWAWLNQYAQPHYLYCALPTIFVILLFAGPKEECTTGERLLVASASIGSYLYASYLGYLTNFGAVVGENLWLSSHINHIYSYFIHMFQSLDGMQTCTILLTFFLPFLWLGSFYSLLFELSTRSRW